MLTHMAFHAGSKQQNPLPITPTSTVRPIMKHFIPCHTRCNPNPLTRPRRVRSSLAQVARSRAVRACHRRICQVSRSLLICHPSFLPDYILLPHLGIRPRQVTISIVVEGRCSNRIELDLAEKVMSNSCCRKRLAACSPLLQALSSSAAGVRA